MRFRREKRCLGWCLLFCHLFLFGVGVDTQNRLCWLALYESYCCDEVFDLFTVQEMDTVDFIGYLLFEKCIFYGSCVLVSTVEDAEVLDVVVFDPVRD